VRSVASVGSLFGETLPHGPLSRRGLLFEGGITPCQVISHPFGEPLRHNAVMDEESKSHQRRKDQRIARNRRQKTLHHDRLTPTDLLKLIPSPIMLPDQSLGDYARRLEQRRERLHRLTARFAGKEFVYDTSADSPSETRQARGAGKKSRDTSDPTQVPYPQG